MDPWALRRRTSVTGGTVAWDRFGDGPPVVLVHGTPSWSFLWRNVVPILAERFTVYVLDLVGYGGSERRPDGDMSISAQGRMLAELLEHWELAAPGLVGHDVGGATVLRAHLLEGRAARGIVLLDAVALNPWNTPATEHMWAHLDAYRTMPLHVYEEVVKAHLRTAVHRPLDGETLAAYLAPWQGADGRRRTSARSPSGRRTTSGRSNRSYRRSPSQCASCGARRTAGSTGRSRSASRR